MYDFLSCPACFLLLSFWLVTGIMQAVWRWLRERFAVKLKNVYSSYILHYTVVFSYICIMYINNKEH